VEAGVCLGATCQVYNELVTGLQIELANICRRVVAGENEAVKLENNAVLSFPPSFPLSRPPRSREMMMARQKESPGPTKRPDPPPESSRY
jgi:hypothetical protein